MPNFKKLLRLAATVLFFMIFCAKPASADFCSALAPFNGTRNDATSVIQNCINNVAGGGTVELPAGKFYVKDTILIEKTISFKTYGKSESSSKCDFRDNHDCAEIIALPDFYSISGKEILRFNGNGIIIDHIVVNGNKGERMSSDAAQRCASNNVYGSNIRLQFCTNCQLKNSVFKNALCGTGLGIEGSVKAINNTIAFNGLHNTRMLWSDGLTTGQLSNSEFSNNEFIDNTDIDFILGGCTNCTVKNNKIRHTESYGGGSFAAFMLHTWTTATGNYAGTETSDNSIDCGPNKNCGFGLMIGCDPWNYSEACSKSVAPGVYGGSVHDNTIANAQQGINIDDARDMEVYNNIVTNTGGSYKTGNCGFRTTNSYNIGLRSTNINTAKDILGTSYTRTDWDGCIPNNFQNENPANDAEFISQNIPVSMVAGNVYDVSVIMQNTGTAIWNASGNYRLGSQNPRDSSTLGFGRVYLAAGESIAPGQTKTFTFKIAAPTVSGTYNFQWRMLQDGVEWFGASTENIAVTVVTPAAQKANGQQCASSADCVSGNCNNSYCCGAGQCGGVASPYCFSDGAHASNPWFDGYCRASSWKTKLGGNCSVWPCEQGICANNICVVNAGGDVNGAACVSNSVCQSGVCQYGYCMPQSNAPLIQRMKTKGCQINALLTPDNNYTAADYDSYFPMLARSRCEYLLRAVETWAGPIDFNLLQTRINKLDRSYIIEANFAEFIKTNAQYYYPDENRNFDFSAMCVLGSFGTYGANTCTPYFKTDEYQKYLRYVSHKLIDMGIQSFMFGQIYAQDSVGTADSRASQVLGDMRQYAASKGKTIVIGAQTNNISDESYLRLFDYISGGPGLRPDGSYDSGPCSATYSSPGFCWALLDDSAWASKANNVILTLDNLEYFVQLSRDQRASSLSYIYSLLVGKNMGFVPTLGYPLTGTANGCVGYNSAVYSADSYNPLASSTMYTCRDENAINGILGGGKACDSSRVVGNLVCKSDGSGWQNLTCVPNAVSGCKVCNAQGTAWMDTDSRCQANQKCQNGTCVTTCVSKTCSTIGSYTYTCGTWSNGCGGTVSCGTCPTSQTCSAGICVSNCTSHAAKKCDSNNLYWYNSCNVKEELAQNCGINENTSNYQCNKNWTQQKIIAKGCLDSTCFTNPAWNNVQDCSVTSQICSAGACVTGSASSTLPIICTPKTCADLGYFCGTALDTCGGTLNCGICSNNNTCYKGACVAQDTANTDVGTDLAALYAQIEYLKKEISRVQALLAAKNQTTISCTQLTKNLYYGMTNDPEVKCLQEFLKAQGLFDGPVTGNFYNLTKTAVIAFQEKYSSEILTPLGLTRGTGIAAGNTRAKINQLLAVD